MSAVCREGHLSDEPDYCSVCGAPIVSGPGSPTPAAGTPIPIPSSARFKDVSSSHAACPSCGEPREDASARYCEVCRYDFLEQRPGPPPVARGARPAVPAPAAPAPAAAPSPAPAPGRKWELVVTVDPALDTDPDPQTPCPVGQPETVLPVEKAEMLVGRHDETRAIHPEVSLHDPGASRRHSKFVLDADGTLVVQDLASTNGTQVNGQDLPPGTRRSLREGDKVTLGRWTRITVRVRA